MFREILFWIFVFWLLDKHTGSQSRKKLEWVKFALTDYLSSSSLASELSYDWGTFYAERKPVSP